MKYFFYFTFILIHLMAGAQPPLTRILFLFDASQSMLGEWQTGKKIDIAQRIMSKTLDSLQRAGSKNLELALRLYGHQKQISPGQQDCDDTRLEVPFSKNNYEQIKTVLKNIYPKGTTPIARSLMRSSNDFPPCDNCRNIIILITDGVEACDEDPCAASHELQQKGIILKPFVIGVGLDPNFIKTFECVGNYYDATNETSFNIALGVVISHALNSTTAQVNLLDIYGKATETNVNMTFYDMFSGKMRYNYIHTMNARGVPDTVVIDPLGVYRLNVHTIPPVEKDSITLTPGKHTIIATETPQGMLNLKVMGRSDYKNLQCIVRKKGEAATLNVQDFNTTVKYLIGKYDLEVLSLPRIYINDVEIKQSHTTTVEIPQPGIASVITEGRGLGTIFLVKDNKLELIYNLREGLPRETLLLQPGKYKLVFRPKYSPQAIFTREKDFTIEPGSTTVVNIN
ncbi:MAG: VWA domain-containing protein [Bacteroidetes bacterium]|nr:VWA domain-containing protein [Bacteroidota bacterium]